MSRTTAPKTITRDNDDLDLAVRAAWLSYIGGYSQEQIAKRLSVSRIKAHRLILSALDRGMIKVSIEHKLSDLADLEERLIKRYGLNKCLLAPRMSNGSSLQNAEWTVLGMIGAKFLHRQLLSNKTCTIGVGWGRTLAAVAEQLQQASYKQHRLVALIGSLTRHSAANPYDVIHRLVARTGAEGYYLPVPYIADTLNDKAVFMAQKSVQDILQLAHASDVCLVGIGQCSEQSFLKQAGLINEQEFTALQQAGAVGDLIGRFFDAQGQLVDSEVNDRCIGLELTDLAQLRAIAIAGGLDKTNAIRAALKGGHLHGLITDEAVAQQLLHH